MTTCPHCKAELNMNPAGYASHVKKCKRARPWQRDYFVARGKWPSKKATRIVDRTIRG
jgi:hypothetical protein